MKKTISFALCYLLCIAAFAQKNLKEGFVVLNSNDTLAGFIDYREWYKNPTGVQFSTTKETPVKRYKIRDVSYFSINGRETYQRFTVMISMDRKSMGNIGEKDTASRRDTVFLKVLQQGKNISLFSYSDDVKQRFYILPANETVPVELQNSVYLLNGQVTSEMEYRPILAGISRRFPTGSKELQTLIYTQNYSPNSIRDICYRINGIDQQVVKKVEKNKPASLRFFAGLSANRGLISFEGDNHYTGKSSEPSYGLEVHAGADMFVNPAVGRMFFRTQLSVSSYQTEGYYFANYFDMKENYYLRFKQRNIALHEQLNYNLYNGQNLKWFVGAGAGFNFSSYPLNEEKFIKESSSDTSTTINNNYIAKIKKFWMNASFRSGFAIRHLDVALAYFPKSSIVNYTHYQVANSSVQLQVTYMF